jgi:hypothetical protein
MEAQALIERCTKGFLEMVTGPSFTFSLKSGFATFCVAQPFCQSNSRTLALSCYFRAKRHCQDGVVQAVIDPTRATFHFQPLQNLIATNKQ